MEIDQTVHDWEAHELKKPMVYYGITPLVVIRSLLTDCEFEKMFKS